MTEVERRGRLTTDDEIRGVPVVCLDQAFVHFQSLFVPEYAIAYQLS